MSRVNSISSKEAISNLLKYSEAHHNLLQKYSLYFFARYFDTSAIQELQERMGRLPCSQRHFIIIMTNFILHPKNETLFLVMGLLDLFAKIAEDNNGKEEVGVKELTQFICGCIGEQSSDILLESKQIRTLKHCDPLESCEIDLNPPTIQYHSQKQFPKMSKSLKKVERRVDNQKPVHLFQINRKMQQVIAIGRLSSQIGIFDFQLNKVQAIVPAYFRQYSRNSAIMSLAFSQSQQRIGCIITNIGMLFWDYQDAFSTEKVIRKYTGDKIYFLPVLQEWVTTTHNTIYTWDLKMEKIVSEIPQDNATSLHHLEEITHLRCIVASYTMKDGHKWLIIYKNDRLKVASKLKLGLSGAQKIHYHQHTQTILLLGNNQLPVLQIDPSSFDLSRLAQLEGHQSVITSVTDLSDGFVVSGDDRGVLRIWDLSSLRCQQVVKVASLVTLLQHFDNRLFFADSRLNIIHLQQLKQRVSVKDQYGLFTFYELQCPCPELYLFTNTSCRVYTLTDGRTRRVVELCTPQEQILAVDRLNQSFLVSTSKGRVLCYSHEFNLKWKMGAQQFGREQITHIKADPVNRFFSTVTKEGNLSVWCQGSFREEGPRKSIINQSRESSYQISLFDLSQKYGLMVTCDKTKQVKIWDYESCKLCHLIEMERPACAIKICEYYPMMAVGCPNDKVYLYRLRRKQQGIEVQFLQYGHLRFPLSKLNSLLSVESTSQLINTPRRRNLQVKSIYCQGIVFYMKGESAVMSVGYGKGNVICFDLGELCRCQFKPQSSFKTFNVQRPVRQLLQKQLAKQQYSSTFLPEAQLNQGNKLRVAWNKNLHGDTITSLGVLQNNLVSMALSGELKISTLDQGKIIAVIHLQQPLPLLWKLELSQEQRLCKKVHQALTLIASIIDDKITPTEVRQVLNVEWLMRQVCSKSGHSSFRKKRKSVKTLSYTPVLQKNNNYQSLKSMQAFRRVSLIRKSNNSIISGDFSAQKKYLNSLRDKEEMIKLLSPHYSIKQVSRADNKKYAYLVESAPVSPANSPPKPMERAKENNSLASIKKYALRSRSQVQRKLWTRGAKLRQDSCSKRMQNEFQSHEPIKALNSFIRQLKQKECRMKGKQRRMHGQKRMSHLKKHSGFSPYF